MRALRPARIKRAHSNPCCCHLSSQVSCGYWAAAQAWGPGLPWAAEAGCCCAVSTGSLPATVSSGPEPSPHSQAGGSGLLGKEAPKALLALSWDYKQGSERLLL